MKTSLTSEELDRLLLEREKRFGAFSGRVVFRALPSMAAERAEQILTLFRTLGLLLTNAESHRFRAEFLRHVEEGFASHSSADVTVRYDSAHDGRVNYEISSEHATLADKFEEWLPRGEVLFGSHPDAMVLHSARDVCAAAQSAQLDVLDMGAGNGRNALALARLQHRVDAIEMTEGFALQIEKWALRQKLDVEVLREDLLESGLRTPRERYDLIILSQVTSHFRSALDLRRVFARADALLSENGRLVMTAFVAEVDYEPSETVRETAIARWSTCYSESDFAMATKGLSLKLLQDVPVVDYERAHLPKEAWPPTSWFIDWARGQNILPIDSPPIELKWRVYGRTGAAG